MCDHAMIGNVPAEGAPALLSALGKFGRKKSARATLTATVNTVLGPVESRLLGVTLLRESLLYVLPGAQYAYDIRIDRAELFDRLAAKLAEFKSAGGGTLVDATGMFEGRDLPLYEALAVKVATAAPIVPYLLLVLMLIVRPRGLLGTRDA